VLYPIADGEPGQDRKVAAISLSVMWIRHFLFMVNFHKFIIFFLFFCL